MSDGRLNSPRLVSIDGWRAIAVLGVIWWHTWIHTGNPSFIISLGGHNLNLERLLVPLGNGVHFFFVISGFCIHQSITRGFPRLTAGAYGRFVLNRWKRLSPAFYAVCAVTALALWLLGRPIAISNLAAHSTWLFGFWPGAWQLAPVFWSLQVEWEFYLCAPLVLLISRPSLRWSLIGALVLVSLAFRYHLHNNSEGIPVDGEANLPMHFAAFACGMALAEGWLVQARWLARLRGWFPLIGGLGLAYFGRGVSSTELFVWLGPWGVLAKTLGQPLMALGFAVMLASTLTKIYGVSNLLESAPVQTIGRLSYSLYLWHWWPSVWISHALIAHLGPTVLAHYLSLFGTLAVCLPLAWLTYKFCERPYFRTNIRHPATTRVSTNSIRNS